MKQIIEVVLNILVKVIDAVPVLKGYRTFIVLCLQAVAGGLAAFNVIDQDTWLASAAILGGVGTLTGLANKTANK